MSGEKKTLIYHYTDDSKMENKEKGKETDQVMQSH